MVSRRRTPAGTGPQYGQVLYAASSVRKRASAFGHILRLFGPAEDGTRAAPNAAAKNAGPVFAPLVCARGAQRNRVKTAALNELLPKTIRENAETEYRPNARFLNRHSGPITKKAAALSHGQIFILRGGTIGHMAHTFALAHSKTIRLRLLLHDCARCIRQQHSHRHAGSGTARISLHICPGSAAAADRAQAGEPTNACPLVRTFAAALPTRLHGSKIAHTKAQNTRMTRT